MRGAQKLFGVLTIGRGSAQVGGGGGGSQRSPKRPKDAQNVQKGQKNWRFPALIDLKIAKNTFFYFKVLSKIYSRYVF